MVKQQTPLPTYFFEILCFIIVGILIFFYFLWFKAWQEDTIFTDISKSDCEKLIDQWIVPYSTSKIWKDFRCYVTDRSTESWTYWREATESELNLVQY